MGRFTPFYAPFYPFFAQKRVKYLSTQFSNVKSHIWAKCQAFIPIFRESKHVLSYRALRGRSRYITFAFISNVIMNLHNILDRMIYNILAHWLYWKRSTPPTNFWKKVHFYKICQIVLNNSLPIYGMNFPNSLKTIYFQEL